MTKNQNLSPWNFYLGLRYVLEITQTVAALRIFKANVHLFYEISWCLRL